jgi:hypothetical protein
VGMLFNGAESDVGYPVAPTLLKDCEGAVQ